MTTTESSKLLNTPKTTQHTHIIYLNDFYCSAIWVKVMFWRFGRKCEWMKKTTKTIYEQERRIHIIIVIDDMMMLLKQLVKSRLNIVYFVWRWAKECLFLVFLANIDLNSHEADWYNSTTTHHTSNLHNFTYRITLRCTE